MRVGIALPLAFAAAACATMGEPAPAPGPPPFEGVKSIALVRFVGDPAAQRPKDALDALRESLDERGYRTRVLEVGPRGGDRGLERLFASIHSRIAVGTGRDRIGAGRGEEEASATLAALGVDAVAMVHRFEALTLPTPLGSPFEPPPPGSMLDPGGPALRQYRPIGALSLVNRAGNVVWFDWGTQESADLGAPANAAEAVDALLAVLAGRETDEP